jgi:oligosaccharide repeat unit polymerase
MKKQLLIINLLLALAFATAGLILGATWQIVLTFLLVYGILLSLLHSFHNLLHWIDPTSLFIANYIAFIGVGVIATGWFDVSLAPEVYLALSMGLAAFVSGSFFGEIALNGGQRLSVIRQVQVVQQPVPWARLWAILFYCAGLATIALFFLRIGAIPILLVDAENSRFTLRAGSASLPIIAYAFFMTGTLTLIAHARTKWAMIGAGILVGIAALALIGGGFRAPAVKFFLAAFIVFAYVRFSRIPWFWLAIFLSGIILFVGVMGFFRREAAFTSDLTIIFRLAVFRIFVNNLYVIDLVFDLYPIFEPFMYGRSYVIDAITLLPGPQPHFGFWLKDRFGLTFDGGGVTQTIVGEFYLNFGWGGIIVGMFLLGMAFRMLYRAIVRKPVISSDTVVMATILGMALMATVSSGLSLTLFFEVLPTMGVYLTYRFVRRLRLRLSAQPANVPSLKSDQI